MQIGQFSRPEIPTDITPEATDMLLKSLELKHEARPTASDLLVHPFITARPTTMAISESQAQATMAAAHASAQKGMAGFVGVKAG